METTKQARSMLPSSDIGFAGIKEDQAQTRTYIINHAALGLSELHLAQGEDIDKLLLSVRELVEVFVNGQLEGADEMQSKREG